MIFEESKKRKKKAQSKHALASYVLATGRSCVINHHIAHISNLPFKGFILIDTHVIELKIYYEGEEKKIRGEYILILPMMELD